MLNFINFYENVHQIHNKMSYHMDYNGYLKKKKTSVGKDIERLEGLYIASRNVK